MDFDSSIHENSAQEVVDETDGKYSPDSEADCMPNRRNIEKQIQNRRYEHKRCSEAWNERSDHRHCSPEHWIRHSENPKTNTAQNSLDNTDNKASRHDRVNRLLKFVQNLLFVCIFEWA